jgi:ADP-ribose pyrophosphatase
MSEVLFDTKFLQLKKAQSPKGHPWVYAHRPNVCGVVAIVPILHNPYGDEIIFIETKRPPIYAENVAETCIEFPAGLVGDEIKDESIEDAIKKELLEETGYMADKVEILAKNVTSSGGCVSEVLTIARADIKKDIQAQKPLDDGGIIIKLYKIPVKDIREWLKNQETQGKAVSSFLYTGLYLCKVM